MKFKIISPIDGDVVAERDKASNNLIDTVLSNAEFSFINWKSKSLLQRSKLCNKAIDILMQDAEAIAKEITLQMGRPISSSQGEIRGVEERARYMIDIAESALSDTTFNDKYAFKRHIKREPLGVVFVIAPWNYPYLTAINTIIPALMAGNCVILKHSAQTLLCAERFFNAFSQAGLGPGVFQYLHLDHESTCQLIKRDRINFISFTGSVAGGKIIEKTVAGLFKGVGLELGGKDAAYVRADADIALSVESLVDGAFFNSGQSCCGIERIYLHNDIYDAFIDQYIKKVKKYKLGNPLDLSTTLGPMVSCSSADLVRAQIEQACKLGAIACIDESLFTSSKQGTPYLAPQVLINVDHTMSVMTDETFGPVAGLMKVNSDEEAIKLINDSVYGLTASIWTKDAGVAESIGETLQVGTVYMNRCDYLDPALAWCGVKQSGRGCSLSALGYQQLSRPKSYHFKVK